MAEIIGKLDPEVLKARMSAASLDRNIDRARAIHKQKRERERASRREEARVRTGKFNSIKVRE